MARVIWSPTALPDLEAILSFVALDSPANARRLGERMLARVELIANQPESGGYVLEDRYERAREVLVGRYRIIYELENECSLIRIITILHGSRLLK